jgi:hypothetical protein
VSCAPLVVGRRRCRPNEGTGECHELHVEHLRAGVERCEGVARALVVALHQDPLRLPDEGALGQNEREGTGAVDVTDRTLPRPLRGLFKNGNRDFRSTPTPAGEVGRRWGFVVQLRGFGTSSCGLLGIGSRGLPASDRSWIIASMERAVIGGAK